MTTGVGLYPPRLNHLRERVQRGGFTLPVCHLNKGTSEDLFARMNEQTSPATPRGWLGKKAA